MSTCPGCRRARFAVWLCFYMMLLVKLVAIVILHKITR